MFVAILLLLFSFVSALWFVYYCVCAPQTCLFVVRRSGVPFAKVASAKAPRVVASHCCLCRAYETWLPAGAFSVYSVDVELWQAL